MLKWLAKRYALKVINDALNHAARKHDVKKYIGKISSIITFLALLLDTLKDGEITQDEIKSVSEKAKEVFCHE